MKDIKNYEGLYAITEDGKVWSYRKEWLAGKPKMKMIRKGHFLKINRKSNKGYLMVGLCKNSITKNKSLHRLVAQAFISNQKNFPQVNHKNGIKTDNRIENLEWCTNLQNRRHGIKLGILDNRGEHQGNNKLKNKDVFIIRSLFSKGIFTKQAIANKYRVSISLIRKIVKRERWKHI